MHGITMCLKFILFPHKIRQSLIKSTLRYCSFQKFNCLTQTCRARWFLTQNHLERRPHKTVWAGNLKKKRKKNLGRWLDEPTVYHCIPSQPITSTGVDFYHKLSLSINQTLYKASRGKSKNIFSKEQSLQCRSLLFLTENTPQFWYKRCDELI